MTISGNKVSRLFSIASEVAISFSNLSLIDGYASANGGAFINNGNLQLENIKFLGNKNGASSKAFTNLGDITMASTINVFK